MSNLNQDLARLEQRIAEDEARLAETAQIRSGIKDRLRAGDSTGDSIKDFSIFTGANPKVEQFYRQLDERLTALAGQPIALKWAQHSPGFSRRPLEDQLNTHDTFKLGFLNERLTFSISENPNIILANEYVERTNSKEWILQEKPLSLSLMDILELTNSGHLNLLTDFYRSNEKLIITPGTKQVEDNYFRSYQLHKPQDLTYVDALKLLGRPVPEDFQIAYDTKRKIVRREILTQLEEIIQPSADVTTQSRINELLAHAVKLDMHTIHEVYEPQPGKKIDVPAYINGLCARFKVGPYAESKTA